MKKLRLTQIKSTLTAILIVFSILMSNAQTKIIIGGKYWFNQRIYTYEQLDSIFSDNSIAYLQYLEFDKCKVNMKSYKNSVIGFGVLGATSLVASVSMQADNFFDSLVILPVKIIGLGVGFGFSLAALVNLHFYMEADSNAEKHLQKAVYYLNDNSTRLLDKREAGPSLGFGLTNSGGVGFVYSF